MTTKETKKILENLDKPSEVKKAVTDLLNKKLANKLQEKEKELKKK